MENDKIKTISISLGIPSVVVGVLIALKHIGLTSISYSAIAIFGLKVWIACALIMICVMFALYVIGILIGAIFGAFKDF
jgi:hypothetical protein